MAEKARLSSSTTTMHQARGRVSHGGKRAAEQETTTMHQVRGLVSHGGKRAAEQETTTMHRARGRVSHGGKGAAEQFNYDDAPGALPAPAPPASYI